MKSDYQNSAKEFLEISSEQRLAILLRLNQNKSKISILAKELDATVPEVYRNFERLAKADLITKDSEGDYEITTYGKIICGQISSIQFMSENKKYFKNHDFGNIPQKFLQRIGALTEGRKIKGFVKVMEKWSEIYKNADEYIFNILYEVPYTSDLMMPLVKKVESGVKLRSILSETAILSKERKQVIDKLGIKKLIEKGLMERKIQDIVSVVLLLNEKEGCIMFPGKNGEVDLAEGFYGNDSLFQDWCHDYFDYCWNNAHPFQESKMKRE
jgi:predicted transcriptional regulator